MAEYDGSIRISTEVDEDGLVSGIKKMSSQTMKLTNQIKQTQEQIDKLQSELQKLGETPVENKGMKRLKEQIAAAESELDQLYEKRGRLEVKLVDPDMEKISSPKMIQQIYGMSDEWKKLTGKINEAEKALGQYQVKLQDTKTTENAQDTPIYQKKAAEVEKLTGELEVLKQKLQEVQAKEKGTYSGFERIKAAVSGVTKGAAILGGIAGKISGGFRKLGAAAVNAFRKAEKSAGRAETALGRFKSRLKSLLSGLLIFNVISASFRKLFDGVGKGIEGLAQQSANFNRAMSSIKSSLSTLHNSLASAFAPIVQTAAPYLVKLINLLTRATNAIAQFIAALTGQSTWHKAVEVQDDYAGSLDGTKDSAEDAKDAIDAAKKSLAAFDELDVQSSNKALEKPNSGGGGTSGPGYVEVPIDEGIAKWAEKLKKILKKLFEPLRKAWDREGKYVMDSWKYALDEVGKLAKDIGRDFLIVWNQEATVKIFEDILHILGDIGQIVGNLAAKFREAWNENNTGLHILENIRDIIGIVVANIRKAIDFTVEWSKKLNFTPLLESFERLTEALKPFADFVSGTLADFYTNFILPLVQWSMETGLPEIGNAFADFFDSVDWEGLREALGNLYTALEPYAEEFAQGLIDFLDGLLGFGADMLNKLPGPIQDLADALNDGDPEQARSWGKTLIGVAGGITALKLAWTGFKGFAQLKILFGLLTGKAVIGGATAKGMAETAASAGEAAAGMETAAKGAGKLTKAFDIFAATSAALVVFEPIKQGLFAIWSLIDPDKAEVAKERWSGLSETFKMLGDAGNLAVDAFSGMPIAIHDASQAGAALEGALKKIGDGTIYTDAQLEKMRKNFQLSDDDLEMLRQEMLETNPELRELGDALLSITGESYTAETLRDIAEGLDYIEKGALNVVDAGKVFSGPMWGFSEVAKDFFSAVSDGSIKIEDLSTQIDGLTTSSADGTTALQDFYAVAGNLGSDVVDIGINVGLGLLQGYKESAVNIPDAASFFANAVEEETKGAFGIQSPARRMMPLGGNILLGVLEGFKDKLTSVPGYVAEFFNGLVNAVTEKLSGFLDRVRNAIQPVVDFVMGSIAALREAISNLLSQTSRLGRSVSLPAIKTKASAAYSFRSYTPQPLIAPEIVRNLQIPALATGTVIPANMSRFLAVLGDNNHEAEVVSPLSTMEQAVISGVGKVFEGMKVDVTLTGDNDVADLLLKFLRTANGQWKKQHGGRGAFD